VGELRECDAELVRRSRGGDKVAFGELLSRHGDTARALAQRLLRDHELARDAVQEASVAAFLSLERLRAPERFGAWLCGIALNVARRWLRQVREFDVPGAELVDTGPGPDEAAETILLRESVRNAIGRLPAGQRDATYLFYLHGLTHREVAGELDITIGAVKARLHQARAALARRLADQRIEEIAMTSVAESVPVTIAEVRRGDGADSARRAHVVVLQETAGTRALAIWIGPAEAVALALTLESEQMPRPMTYQFTANLLSAAGSMVEEVRISRLDGAIYLANVILNGPGGRKEVDARPSDVLNLAALLDVPIRVDASLLARTSVEPDLHERYPTATAELAAEMRAAVTRSDPHQTPH